MQFHVIPLNCNEFTVAILFEFSLGLNEYNINFIKCISFAIICILILEFMSLFSCIKVRIINRCNLANWMIYPIFAFDILFNCTVLQLHFSCIEFKSTVTVILFYASIASKNKRINCYQEKEIICFYSWFFEMTFTTW